MNSSFKEGIKEGLTSFTHRSLDHHLPLKSWQKRWTCTQVLWWRKLKEMADTHWKSSLRGSGIPGNWRSDHWQGNASGLLCEENNTSLKPCTLSKPKLLNNRFDSARQCNRNDFDLHVSVKFTLQVFPNVTWQITAQFILFAEDDLLYCLAYSFVKVTL